MHRSLPLAALLTLLAALPALAADPKPAKPPAAKDQAKAPAPAPGGTVDMKELSLSGYLGGELGDLDLLALRADASLPLAPLTPALKLHGVLSLGFGHGSQDIPYGSASWNMLTLIPAARVQLRAAPRVELYGDLGLGLYMGFASSDVTFPGLPPVTSSDTSFGVVMRIAVGGLYELNKKVKLAAELGLNPYFGDASTTSFVVLVGVQFKT